MLAALAWAAAGLLRCGARVRSAASPRALAAAVLCALLSAIVMLVLDTISRHRLGSRFALVALGFYGGGLALPIIGLSSAAAAWRRARSFDLPLVIVCVLPLLASLDALLIEPDRLEVVRRTLPVAQWPTGSEPFRIVHISDPQTVGACARERRAADLIASLNPDPIVWCGDYLAGPYDDPEPAIAAARAFLGALHARHGVVCVAGHSESEALRARVLDGFDVVYLENEERRIPDRGS